MAVQDLERIEQKIDRAAAGAIAVSDNVGGIMFSNMSEVMEFSKLLSLSGASVPKHLRGNPGGCLAVTIQALEWRMSPIAVANKSYEVNDRIAYESQLIHGVVEARAPIKQRLRCSYDGEGLERVCIVTGHFKGELDPVEYRSPKFKDITPKNSPLWKSDPDQQLWYYSVRAFARRYCPDVLLGIYSEEELEEIGPEHAKDVTPSVGSRLKGQRDRRGFDKDGVEKALEHKPAQTLDAGVVAKPEPVTVAAIGTVASGGEQQLALDNNVENEIETKTRAVANVTTKDDLKTLVAATTEYLKSVKRTDLLSNFLSAASAREKKLEV